MTIPNTFNRHYPFAQRDFSFVFPWDVTKLPVSRFELVEEIPKGNGIDLFGNDITKIIDEPDLIPPLTGTFGETKRHNYSVTTRPAGLPAGWDVVESESNIAYALIVRTAISAFGAPDNQRPNRRVYRLWFGIVTRAIFTVFVTNPSPVGSYRIRLSGHWTTAFNAIPTFPDPFWEEADTPPTLHRLSQKGHRDYHRQFVPADWVLTLKNTDKLGTVTTDVEDFMDDWLDDLEADLSGATTDATFRLAGIGWGLPTDIGNRNFIVNSSIGVRY
jgi:hypothetical protein